ncbi:MAG TPA: glycoside hydrolase family 2 TIM barrel-domain containing protein [Terriglobales bacterium]|nr:glycoside hydrolase family 2 TIM barrel-domain containing protein [Terriglobales bacterium]
MPLATSFDDAPRLELLHGWELLTDPSGRMSREAVSDATGWRPARVGLSWNAQFEDLRDYMGVAWYRTHFRVPQFDDSRHALLKFGGVDYFAEVYVNGVIAGTHEGGYTPFSFDITLAAKPGVNELMVRVIDPPMDEAHNRELCPEMLYNEIPHGKQNWYLQNAGIWQGVRLEFCPAIYVDAIRVTPHISGDFQLEVRLAGSGSNDPGITEATAIRFSIQDRAGRVACEGAVQPAGPQVQVFQGHIPNPKLWSPETPALYSAEVSLHGAVQYRKRVRFGFRKFLAQGGKFFFNDKPFYLVGTLDQDFYPETIHTPASEEFVREMMLKAKGLGINVLRCHLKVAHPVYLTVADEVGMLVWTEMPSWSDCWYPSDHFSQKAAARGRAMFQEVLDRDWNHPCVVIQTIMNESWGIDLSNAEQRGWLKDTFNRVKEELSPVGRLVIDNSACEKNFHIKTDIEDFHNYYSMPDDAEKWEKWTAELATRPPWTFSPYGDAERSRHEPILVSEFGNWGLPKLPDNIPWWFDRSFGGREVTNPAGVLERFHTFQLGEIFGDFNTFAEQTQWHQYASLKHEIEDIRSHATIQGYVITGMTDVHWEVNGLLDMWRNPKVFAAELTRLQKPDLIMLALPSYNFWGGMEARFEVQLSHYSTTDLKGARVRWMSESGQSGQWLLTENLESGSVHRLQPITMTMPTVEKPRTEHLHVELRAAKGALLAENTYDLFVFPKASPSAVTVKVHDPQGTANGLAQRMAHAGYEIAQPDEPAKVLLATAWDEVVDRHAENGTAVLLLLDSESAVPQDAPFSVAQRDGSDLDGRWFSNYNWIRAESEIFHELSFTKILGFESAAVVPRHILRNIPGENFDQVIAGITYGWVAKNSALLTAFALGNNTALATTFRFHQYGSDPYATHLLDRLIKVCSLANATSRLHPQAAMATE